jgi:very-short-patch-repair endonuclease
MVNRKPKSEIARAKRLRKDMTSAESTLWRELRSRKLLGVKFRRQLPIGGYIVDFCSLDPKLVIEVDGGQHSEMTIADGDAERTAELERIGYRVMRFWNNDVLSNTEAVLAAIEAQIEKLRRPSA